jgi:acyl-CoA thioester hydrolase
MFVHRLEVRFRDCDPMGHVNNAVYLTYLEQARLAHWRSLWGRGAPPAAAEMPGVILARIECDYRRSATYGEVLDVRMAVAAVGRTSFKYEYEIIDGAGHAVLEAKSVQVMYDYGKREPVPIPSDVRAVLEREIEAPPPSGV